VSFLYWQAKEDGLEYAIKNSNPDTGLDGKVVDPNFSFEPAFRLALGFYLPHDCWDVSFYYTRFESKSRDDDTSVLNEPISSAGRGLIPVWVHPAAFGGSLNDIRWANAKATWKIRYNVIDARLGKDFCVNCILALNPYFGLKNGIIHQNFNVSYRNGNVVSIENSSVTPIATDVALKNFSYGIGPLLGLASSWRIGCSWSFFTNLSFSLLHTRFNLSRIENDLSTQIINGQTRNDRAEFSEKYWTYKPQAELAIGIRWDKCFGCSSHLGIGAAYEGSYW